MTNVRPSSNKRQWEERILIIDDFGKVRSGSHFKILARVFFGLGLSCLLAASLLGYLFVQARNENIELKIRLTQVEEKVVQLKSDKEILMARLVMAGKDAKVAPDAPAPSDSSKRVVTKKKKKTE